MLFQRSYFQMMLKSILLLIAWTSIVVSCNTVLTYCAIGRWGVDYMVLLFIYLFIYLFNVISHNFNGCTEQVVKQ